MTTNQASRNHPNIQTDLNKAIKELPEPSETIEPAKTNSSSQLLLIILACVSLAFVLLLILYLLTKNSLSSQIKTLDEQKKDLIRQITEKEYQQTLINTHLYLYYLKDTRSEKNIVYQNGTDNPVELFATDYQQKFGDIFFSPSHKKLIIEIIDEVKPAYYLVENAKATKLDLFENEMVWGFFDEHKIIVENLNNPGKLYVVRLSTYERLTEENLIEDKTQTVTLAVPKLQKCPDEWKKIVNRDESNNTTSIDEYMMIEGQRYNPNQIDLAFVKEKCDIQEAE